MFAADYVGALLGGLAFPFVLLPVFGQIRGALLVGALNAIVGLGLVLTVFGKKLARHTCSSLAELDPRVIDLARTEPSLVELNANAFADPRVEVVNADAFTWLRDNASRYDAVIVDMPDADSTATAKLYSIEFYALVRRVLTDGGRMVVQAGSPYFAPKTYWCVEASVREAGLASVPYYASVPSFGAWGFHLASAKQPDLGLPGNAPPLRSLDADSVRAAGVFPVDRRRLNGIESSTLMRPVVLEYAKQEWRDY